MIKTKCIISILLENEAGAVARIVNLFISRGFDIKYIFGCEYPKNTLMLIIKSEILPKKRLSLKNKIAQIIPVKNVIVISDNIISFILPARVIMFLLYLRFIIFKNSTYDYVL
jgi:acetolactate synthase small subunit